MSYSPEGHILHRYDKELQTISRQVGAMADMVVEQLSQSLIALEQADVELAEEVIRRERQVNAMEVSADTQILTIIASLCPVAGDLRALMTASKIINNLERIGDEAAKLANFALALRCGEDHALSAHCPLEDIKRLGNMALTVARQAISSYARLDETEARGAIAYQDKVIQEFEASLYRLMNDSSGECCHLANSVTTVLMFKALERIGQHAQNIAEYAIFLICGEDIRHRTRNPLVSGEAAG